MSRVVYTRKMKIGSFYELNVLYNSSVIKYTDLKFVKVTNKGYNFLDVTTNKVLYFKKHYYPAKSFKDLNDGVIQLTLPTTIAVYEVEEGVWEKYTPDASFKDGTYWFKFAGLKAKVKAFFYKGFTSCRQFKERNDILEFKKVTYINK